MTVRSNLVDWCGVNCLFHPWFVLKRGCFSATLPFISLKNVPSYLLWVVAFGSGFAVDPDDVSILILQYSVNFVPLHFVHHLPHRGALIFAFLLGLGPREEVEGIGDDLVFEVFRPDVYTRETILGTVLSGSR